MDYVSLYREVAPGSLGATYSIKQPEKKSQKLPPYIAHYNDGSKDLAPGWSIVNVIPVRLNKKNKGIFIQLPRQCFYKDNSVLPTIAVPDGWKSPMGGVGGYEDVDEMIASRMTAKSAPDEAGKPNYLALTVMAAAIGGILYYGSSSRRSY